MIQSRFRQAFLCFGLLLGIGTAAAQSSRSDSLQEVLAHTADPRSRVDLLLNLKDLHEDTPLNLPYSIRLFREAAALHDTHAMSVAIIPIVNRYASYQEKVDSLNYYIRTLQQLTPGTPEEGMSEFAEMLTGYLRMREEYNREKRIRMAQEAIQWCDSLSKTCTTIYAQTKQLVLCGYARSIIATDGNGSFDGYIPQINIWQEAYELTQQMPNLHVRRAFAGSVFFLQSIAYNKANRFSEQIKFINDYLKLLDDFYTDCKRDGRRPYLYIYNGYVMPYQQLMRGALNAEHDDLAEKYFQEFRKHMLSAGPDDLARNTSYIYEIGYLWHGSENDNDISLQYCDSLTRLIADPRNNFFPSPELIRRVNLDRSRLLYKTGHYDESYKAFQRTSAIQDSLFAAERRQRTETIQRTHDMDRLKLEETRAVIRNRVIAISSFVGIVLLLIGLSIYQYRILRHNRQMQQDIQRHSRKAQESEHMKSTFVNSICRGIGPPLNAIGLAANNLMVSDPRSAERLAHLDVIRASTKLLLSTLDNMLEAANLDSLTDHLQLGEVDIDELCRAEILSISRLHPDSGIEYLIETPGSGCLMRTHAKYFSFVVRALLDNAARFTSRGSITLRYELKDNELQTSITDTGCGVSPEQRKKIFRPMYEHSTASSGLSLALCNMIAERLSGAIRLDESYTEGARFIFTIPIRP